MSVLAVVATVAALAIAVPLALLLVRFIRKRRHVARCAVSATPGQLERIYALVERVGTVPSTGCVLARTNRVTPERECVVPVPQDLADFPWAGKVIEATAEREVQFRFVEAVVAEPALLGKVYRPVRVPRNRTKDNTKERNTFAPDRYFESSSELRSALGTVCPEYPAELLAYLLCVGRSSFEFEPIDQARIGASPAWVQDPEYQTCPECKGRMQLILQLPGTVLSEKAFHRGTFYMFGCATHPLQVKSLGQFT